MILVDTSIWIEYFKGMETSLPLSALIDTNSICINELILTELLPSLKVRKENELIQVLDRVEKLSIEIEWREIVSIQTYNLKNGINRVGIPDLIIAQNAIQNDVKLYARDKHFELMKRHIGLKLFEA